jgi:hypothetical protein
MMNVNPQATCLFNIERDNNYLKAESPCIIIIFSLEMVDDMMLQWQ